MKMKFTFLLTLALGLALPALSPRAVAQDVFGAAPFVDYQGTVFNSAGAPLGSSGTAPNFVANPANYTMQFKIYSAQSGGTLVWAETQTVTVSLGQFSVRLGSGASIAGLVPAPTKTSIGEAFAGRDRYLELAVIIPPSSTAAPILPRLAFQSSPFSFVAQHAKRADSVGSDIAGVVNARVNATSGSSFAGAITATGTTLTGGTFNNGNFNGAFGGTFDGTFNGIFNGNGGNLTNLNGANLTNASVSANKIGPDVGVWTKIGTNLSHSGNVGIRTSTPRYPLSISPATGDLIELGGWAYGTGGGDHFGIGISGFGALQIHTPIPTNDIVFGWGRSATMTETMRITGGGRVGIGTGTPRAPLDVSAIGTADLPAFRYYNNTTVANNPAMNGVTNVSIYANGRVVASEFNATSDARTKIVAERSDSVADLQTLLELRITNYSFKDTILNGATSQKKVIAQEVERIFPQAVKKSTDVVPSIYQKAPFKDGWVTLATDLKPGDRARLIGEKSEGIHEVLEIAEGRFRTDFTTEGDQVFVYGREVNDFRSVDYDAIAMLNVSATQELNRRIQAQEAEVSAKDAKIAALEQRLAKLEAKDKDRDAKMASIEKLLAPATTHTVSLQQNAGTR